MTFLYIVHFFKKFDAPRSPFKICKHCLNLKLSISIRFISKNSPDTLKYFQTQKYSSIAELMLLVGPGLKGQHKRGTEKFDNKT